MTEPKAAPLTDAALDAITRIGEPILYKPFTAAEVEARRKVFRFIIGGVVLVALAAGIFAVRHGAFGGRGSGGGVYDRSNW